MLKKINYRVIYIQIQPENSKVVCYKEENYFVIIFCLNQQELSSFHTTPFKSPFKQNIT